MTAETVPEIVALARTHGLRIEPGSVRVDETGLDYRVAMARTVDGESWVLRIPRRPDVADGVDAEGAILDLVGPALSVAVPDWQVRARDLLAYPLLPGEPGLTFDAATGELTWRLDMTSARYSAAFGELLAQLHGIDVEVARAAGVTVEGPAEVRERWRADVATVRAELDVAEHLVDRWTAWLDDDSYWPDWSVMTHGELYPVHVLVAEDDSVTGVLDWTTAKVSDPGRDFALHHSITTPEAFAVTVEAYTRAGGRVWPRLAEHCAELMAAGPVAYGLYAIRTGEAEHREAALAQLNPPS
ncbi:macrolide 2'-phosphotransferase [Georgenia subflava]|uniref:Phosphotransferase n=1 Tax=Georgenia subflava TaxID=1622177 RepID=A0A6N7EK06_9MICO|nr:macrolide 2'-phosphotransferase [Georgenia subflava]MPV37117.1 phosphotransferase [Georgenia subflava]